MRKVDHELKVLPEYYKYIPCNEKMFELRKDDRDFRAGDVILLREWDGNDYTGRQTKREITYILRDAEQYGLKPGYCILSLQHIGWNGYALASANREDK